MKFMITFLWCMFSSWVWANGVSGLNYTTYAGTGATPSIPPYYSTPLSSGIVSSVNFDWGGGQVLDSGRWDQVIVHFTGYFNPISTGTYYFGTSTDDGAVLTINGSTVVNAWREQGPTFWYGSVYLTAGTPVTIDFWYYENGGGAVAQLYWVNPSNGSWEIVPNTSLATASTYWTPSLCCGGSAAPFNANSTNVDRVNYFANRTTSDSQIYITQIGSNGNISVTQTGTKNNYVYHYAVGDNNLAAITQSGNSSTDVNFSYNIVNGSNNTLLVTQTSTGGAKGSFVNIADNNNTVSVTQSDSGSHYAEIGLSGGNKSVTVNQSGSASHMASIYLSGNPTSLSLQQSGTTQNFYSIQFNCATAGGCSPITVKQGN